MTSKNELLKLAQTMAQAAYDKKGDDIVIMDMEGISYLADYFVLISASNTKMAQGIAQNMKDTAEEINVEIMHREGLREGQWILVDFGGVVCHIFTKDQREFYALDTLWNDAPRVEFEGE